MEKNVTLGLTQMSCCADPERNVEKSILQIKEAAAKGAQLVCLQELFRSTYFCQEEELEPFDLAEPIPGPTTERMARLAKELGIVLVLPLFEKRAEGIYHNTVVVIDSGGHLVGTYRKMHIPDDPHYYEKFYFTPGDLGFQAVPTSCGNLGLLICWDQWFPEAARLTALKGAQILLYPTAIGWLPDQPEEVNRAQHSAWETVQRGHAIANGVFVAAANRVGREDHLTFWGQSFVADPFGRILARASESNNEILIVDCDLSLVEKTRREWCFLRDRRIDDYQSILKRYDD